MKKLSRLDLMNNTILDNTGGLIQRLFESRYARLNIKVSKYDLKRAQVFVGTVNEIIEDETDIIFTLEELFEIFYLDFLRSIDRGLTLESLAKWIRSVEVLENDQEDLTIHHYLNSTEELNISELKNHLKNRRNKENDETAYVNVRLEKHHILRGEVLLHDTHELYPDIDIDVETFISLRFKDIMMEIKSGNYQILKNIVENIVK
jgi:hypothetical protein